MTEEVADGHKILMVRTHRVNKSIGFRAFSFSPDVIKEIEDGEFPEPFASDERMTVCEWMDMFDAIEENIEESLKRVRLIRDLADKDVERCKRDLSSNDISDFEKELDKRNEKTEEDKELFRKKYAEHTSDFVLHFSK